MSDQLVCIGVITLSHGLTGAVKIKTFTQYPSKLISYGILIDNNYKEYVVTVLSVLSNNLIIAKIENIDNRTMADKLKGTKLYIKKNQLPKLNCDDEFYAIDLIGLQLRLSDNTLYGHIKQVNNFNSGDIIEISVNNSNKTVILPFSQKIFPYINLKEQYAILKLPEITE